MKSFYRGHHWNLNSDFFFPPLSLPPVSPERERKRENDLFPLRLPGSLVALSKFNTEPCVRNKNELWLCLTDDTLQIGNWLLEMHCGGGGGGYEEEEKGEFH